MVTNKDTPTVIHSNGLQPGNMPRPWHFNFSIIENSKLLSESFALRYEVYCKERQFLSPESYPSKMEIDDYDKHSVHIAGINQDNLMIGTVRLVLPSPIGFPLFEHCELFPQYQHLVDKSTQRTCAEVSRLAISKLYRRRQNDGLYGLAYRRDFDPEAEDTRPPTPIPDVSNDRRSKPEIILGLYKALYHESKRRGITHWFVAMEKTLLRLLHRFNFDFTPIGPELDYYGPVVPYIAEVAEIEQTVFRNNPELFLDFIAGLEDEFLPPFARDFRKNH